MLEKQIEAKVVRYCRERGLYVRKFSSPANRGVPDRIICGRSRVLFLELKRPGNTLTALQKREMDELIKHDMTATWCISFEQAKAIIDQHFSQSLVHASNPTDII